MSKCDFEDFPCSFDGGVLVSKSIFDTEFIKGQVDDIKINENIYLTKQKIDIKKDFKVRSNSKIDGVVININLKGSASYDSLVTDYKINSREGMTTSSLMNHEYGDEFFSKDTALNSVNIILKKEFLQENFLSLDFMDKYLQKLEEQYCNKVLNQHINYKANLLAYDIYNSPFRGEMQKIFLHSKVLEIIHSEFEYFLKDKHMDTKIHFSNYDKEALYRAKEILIKNMQNPPSIIELAKIVKLNEFKLKIGFKNLFETTPYKFLCDYRMEKAKYLLENSDMNVSEIANEIGYKYVHNFSKTFIQKYKIKPKDVMKSRKYYYW